MPGSRKRGVGGGGGGGKPRLKSRVGFRVLGFGFWVLGLGFRV